MNETSLVALLTVVRDTTGFLVRLVGVFSSNEEAVRAGDLLEVPLKHRFYVNVTLDQVADLPVVLFTVACS